MNDVSCRALLPYFRALDTRGIPRAALVEGGPVSLAFLERPSNRIDWSVFVAICGRLEGIVGRENLRGVTNAMYGLRGLEAMTAAVSLVTRPIDIYTNIFTFVGPALFHNVRSSIEVVDRRHVRITLAIPEDFVDCPAYFELCAGGFEAAPALCGYPPASVRMESSPRACTYDITLDDRRTALEALRARVRRFLVGPIALGELENQRGELRQSFDALRDANEEIERQRRLLAEAEAARLAGEAERARLEEQFQRAQKLEGIGLLAGGIAHDFNNLLTGILGNAELALVELPDDAPARDRVDRIARAAVRAADLTNQLLAYAGRQPPTTAPVDISALVAEMGDLLRAAIPRNVALRLDLAPLLPAVSGDRAQLQQVVMNLLTNAAEAAGPRGGTVWVRTAPTEVTAERLARSWLQTDATPGDYVLVEVRDDGVGMDADTLARIFDPFFTTKRAGRGLGLSAVLGIVNGHLGVLEVDSAPGVGTTFTLLFPSLGAPAPVPTPEPEAAFRATGTALVADDEDVVRGLFAEHLRALGFDVLLAADGEEAVDLLRADPDRVALVVLDRTMPRLSGEATFRELRRIRPDLRVILSSGNEDEAATRALFAEGLAATLKKPYRRHDLVSTVRRVLGG